MTTQTRLERTLPGILDELAAGPTPEYLDDVFARTGRMRQRPGWTFPERWLPMADITRSRAFAPSPPWRLIALALVVIALVVGALLYAGSRQPRVPLPFGPARNGLIPFEKGGDIYVGDPVTGESRLIVGGADTDSAPGFSPDGTLVAFIRLDSANCCMSNHLVVVRPDGSDQRQLDGGPYTSPPWASWTPDSRHLAVIDDVDGHKRLQLIDVTGSTPARQLAAGMEPDSLVYRPPDAKEILFRTTVDGKFGLSVMNADGTNIRTLLQPTDLGDLHLGSIAYSTDGSRIFYQKAFTAEEAAATPYPDNRCCKMWVMNADGTGAQEFTSASTPSWDGEGQPSPDGRWIAFWDGHVAIKSADGTGTVTEISPPLSGNLAFVWSPDSTMILMVPVDDTATQESYLLDPAGGAFRTIPWRVPLSPDWQRLALD